MQLSETFVWIQFYVSSTMRLGAKFFSSFFQKTHFHKVEKKNVSLVDKSL